MQIDKESMSKAVKYFKENGTVTPALLMRKFKIECKTALHVCESIAKRYPNLWRDRHENFMSKSGS